MPLSTGTGKGARQENVEREIAAGKDPKQAVAIAYSQQRENKKKSNDNNDLLINTLSKDIITDIQLLSKLLA